MLKKEEYLKAVRRPYPPLFCTLVCMGYREKSVFTGVLKKPFCYLHMAHVDNVWYYSNEEVQTAGEFALESWSDPKVLKFVQKEFEKREHELLKSTSKTFEDFAPAYQDYMVTLNLVFAADKPIENALRSALLEKISSIETEKIMSELNIPFRDNIYKQEEFDLVNAKSLTEHVKKYIWLKARYGEEENYTVEEATAKLSNIDKEKFLKEWKSSKDKLKKFISKAKKILGDKAILVDLFQYIIYYRTHRTDTINRAQFLAIPLLKVKAKNLKISYAQLLECSGEEALSGKIPTKKVLDERIKDCSVLMDNGLITCLTGQESTKLIAFFKEDVSNVKEFKGSIACKGLLRGKVKIILDKIDLHKVELGDVLVASMTTIEMVPAMKKAAAFVTDEGGVTCHAAIISREMNKPCIIGTKIATKVLKDGNMVEVDANKGIVKILQS
jgi:phosphohistidine swiveling domain-containing protein